MVSLPLGSLESWLLRDKVGTVTEASPELYLLPGLPMILAGPWSPLVSLLLLPGLLLQDQETKELCRGRQRDWVWFVTLPDFEEDGRLQPSMLEVSALLLVSGLSLLREQNLSSPVGPPGAMTWI